MSDSAENDAHLQVLRLLQSRPELSQRGLAAALGVSLGKTHYVLKALLDKGLVKAGNFRRSDNKLGFLYILTPEGVHHRAILTRRFLTEKEAQFLALREEIELLKRETEPAADHGAEQNNPELGIARAFTALGGDEN